MRRLIILLSLIGPAIITSNIDNDAGGIAIYSIAGARYGYNLLWTLIPTIFLLIIYQEMSSRMGVVTGKGLADLIRENYGIKTAFWVMVCLFFTNLGNTMAEFSGWAASMELFSISKYVSVPLGALFVWYLVRRWNYSIFEKIFLFVCLIYLTYIFSAFLAKPDWNDVMIKTVTPSIQWNMDYLIIIVSIIGTSITPWQQFYLQSVVVEKGLDEKDLWAARFDVIFGSIMMGVVAYGCMWSNALSVRHQNRFSRRSCPLTEAVGRGICLYSLCRWSGECILVFSMHPPVSNDLLHMRGNGVGGRCR